MLSVHISAYALIFCLQLAAASAPGCPSACTMDCRSASTWSSRPTVSRTELYCILFRL